MDFARLHLAPRRPTLGSAALPLAPLPARSARKGPSVGAVGAGWWPILLLFVFTTHLPFFAWRWLRSGERRHAATSLTFSLLVVTYGLFVFAPQASLWGIPLAAIFRRVAWASAALSLGLLARHHWRRRRSAVVPPQG